MARAARNLGLFWACVAIPALAAPLLNGTYYGSLGTLEFDTQDGRVSGHYERGGACNFDPDRRVLEGLFEGNVLVGTVTLCQSGSACHERTYPLLAFYDAESGTLTGDVKVEAGCSSPALKGTRLVIQSRPTDDAPASARKRANPRRNAELARKAFDQGQKLLRAHDFQGAKAQFEVALSFDERNWAGYLALGVAEFSLGHVQQALDAYERSIELKGDYPDTYYNVACAEARLGHRKEALQNLRQAVKLGFAEPDLISADKDLSHLLSDDPEFKQLIRKAWDLKTRPAHASKRGAEDTL